MRHDKDALTVTWVEIEIITAGGEVTSRNSFITARPVPRDNLAEVARCARARWTIANEMLHVLKTKGDHLEHNVGPGQQPLCAVRVVLNLIAFAFHTVCEAGEAACRQAREKSGTRLTFFHHLEPAGEIWTERSVGLRPESGEEAADQEEP